MQCLCACAVLALVACGGGGSPPPAPTVTINASVTAVPLGSSPNLNWRSTDASSCQASGAWSGAQTPSGQVAWTPTTPGSYTFALSCTGEGGSGSGQVTVEVLAPPTVALSINPGLTRVGETATLVWSSTATTSCTASGSWNGSQTGVGNKLITQASAGSYNYSLQCSGPGGTVSSQATLQVLATQPNVAITVSPSSVLLGQSSTLTWSSSDATACAANGAWSGTQPTLGTLGLTATSAGSVSFGLTCTGPGGERTGLATLQVAAPAAPTVSISSTPASLALGGSSTITWSSTNASSCTATGNWTGPRSISGNSAVTPVVTGRSSYGLSCTGPGGTTTSTTSLEVAPPTPAVTVSVSPAAIALGQTTTLTWSSANATTCTAIGAWSGNQFTSGTAVFRPDATGTATYGLRCEGPGGTGSGSVLVTVSAPPPPAVTLSLDPSTVAKGQFFSIRWTSSDATICAGGDTLSGTFALSGVLPATSQTVGSSVYSMTCTGPGGSTTKSAILTVTP
jgi:hypothetical protein